MNKSIIFSVICVFFLLTSCKTKEKPSELNYMQKAEQIATEASIHNAVPTIQKGDQLIIFLSAKNMDVVRPFNQTSDRTYVVDSEGEIDFPVIGKLTAFGKTTEDFKQEITNRVTLYVKNPAVSVRLSNFKVTILGEVARPGQYGVPEAQASLISAIGLAGDLTIYGKRDNILVVRNTDGQITRGRINLMDDQFINSPFFQLKQGDVIYVSANETKEKVARQDPNTGIYIAVAGMVIGLAGIFITIFKK